MRTIIDALFPNLLCQRAVLRMQRVRPARRGSFQPLRSNEIAPKFLTTLINRLRRWKYEIVSLHEMLRSLQANDGRRCISLTFDGGYRDLVDHGWPILQRERVPVTVFVPTLFADGLGEPWWLALEQVIANHARLGLVMDGRDYRLSCDRPDEKREAYRLLWRWLYDMDADHRRGAVRDLCARYSVDLPSFNRDFMTWDDVRALAADPLVTIGSQSLRALTLSSLEEPDAEREIVMSRAVIEAALGHKPDYFAYPHSIDDAIAAREMRLVRDAGFAAAFTSQSRPIEAFDVRNLHALPRIVVDGQRASLSAVRRALRRRRSQS